MHEYQRGTEFGHGRFAEQVIIARSLNHEQEKEKALIAKYAEVVLRTVLESNIERLINA
jgi:hypothetical protein